MTLPETIERQQLAILIGAPHRGETSIHNDVTAMHDVLQVRGLRSDEILRVEGRLDRPTLLSFLSALQPRFSRWQQGHLFLYLCGHGFYTGNTAATARVGVELQAAEHLTPEYHVCWDELFQALAVPTGVTFTVLPDHWFTNLLAGRVPAHGAAIVMDAQPHSELACRAHEYDFVCNHLLLRRGVISYYAAATMARATTIGSWLMLIEEMSQADLATGTITAFYQPVLRIVGDVDVRLPGIAT